MNNQPIIFTLAETPAEDIYGIPAIKKKTKLKLFIEKIRNLIKLILGGK